MLLNIHGDIATDDWLTIKVNGETKALSRNDDTIPVVSFQVDENKQYEVEIEQEITASNRTPLWLLFHVITIAIQGLFNVFLLNTGSNWYNDIKAYRLRAKLLIDMQKDTDVNLTFKNSKYDKIMNKWSSPVFMAEPYVVSSIDYIPNFHDFGNQYFNYAKKIASAFVFVILVVGFLLYIAVTHLNAAAIITTSVIIIGLVIVVVTVCISQYKKLRYVRKSFVEGNSRGDNSVYPSFVTPQQPRE